MPPLFAHARIETAEGDVYDRGDRVPADLDGIADLKKHGSVSSDKYEGDPVAEAATVARIAELEHELHELKSAGENGTAEDERR